jgi:hypothetical protein
MSNGKQNMSKWLMSMTAVVALAFAGCQASTPPVNPSLMASLRVMDFAPSPASNVDVYWYQSTTKAVDLATPLTKVQANIHNLGYGGGAVYTDGIPAAAGGTQYHYVVTRVNSPSAIETEGNVTLYPGQNNTVVITAAPSGPGVQFSSFPLADAKAGKVSNTADASSAFVRLMNMQPGSGKLVLRLNDPVTGEVIGSIGGTPGVDYTQVSDYYAIKTAQDTSFALFLTPVGSSNSIAQLSYQTYTAGSYFTIVYSGDTSRIPGELDRRTPQDSSQASSDRIRLRVFPDDNIGADQTNPVDSAFRYNIINGVFVAGGYAPGVNSLGFTVNGDANPNRHNFTVWPVDMFGAGGSNPHLLSDGATWDIHFQSTNIPSHPVDFTGGYVDGAGAAHTLFSKTDKNGIDNSQFNANATISFLVTNGNVDPKKAVTVNLIPIPTQVSSDSVTLVFVSGISLPIGATDPKSTFHMTSTGGATYDTRTLTAGTGVETTTLKASDLGDAMTINADIGIGAKQIPNEGPVTFHPIPGGIYEIVSVGVRPEFNNNDTVNSNKILVILTNAKEPLK